MRKIAILSICALIVLSSCKEDARVYKFEKKYTTEETLMVSKTKDLKGYKDLIIGETSYSEVCDIFNLSSWDSQSDFKYPHWGVNLDSIPKYSDRIYYALEKDNTIKLINNTFFEENPFFDMKWASVSFAFYLDRLVGIYIHTPIDYDLLKDWQFLYGDGNGISLINNTYVDTYASCTIDEKTNIEWHNEKVSANYEKVIAKKMGYSAYEALETSLTITCRSGYFDKFIETRDNIVKKEKEYWGIE